METPEEQSRIGGGRPRPEMVDDNVNFEGFSFNTVSTDLLGGAKRKTDLETNQTDLYD